MSAPASIISQIQKRIQADLPQLPPNLCSWAESHLVTPSEIQLVVAPSEVEKRTFWLVTGQTGSSDGNCRIVYDQMAQQFGLEFTDSQGQPIYQGCYGTFADCVLSL